MSIYYFITRNKATQIPLIFSSLSEPKAPVGYCQSALSDRLSVQRERLLLDFSINFQPFI